MTTTLLPASSGASLDLTALATEHLRRTVLENPWVPRMPTPKQALFLSLPHEEAFYGGAAGGGKSVSLLMGALQYAETPGYAAILFRRTYPDLALPDAVMDVAQQWLRGTAAKWHEATKTWGFPSGATLSFGYMEHEPDKWRYQSAQFQFIGWDELTEFEEPQYRFLFSRLRRPVGLRVPLRVRAASNPGGVGHEWVKARFIDPGDPSRPFIPARLDDNPHLDLEAYRRSLAQLDPITRVQLLHGDWTARRAGGLFRRETIPIVDALPRGLRLVRYWDTASTVAERGRSPDWTVGVLMGATARGEYYVADVRRGQWAPSGVDAVMRQTAQMDGAGVEVWQEEEGGASGKGVVDYRLRHVMAGFAFRGDRVTGSKLERAKPLSAQADAGNVHLLRGSWNAALLDELEAFPSGPHDDQVDAAAGAFNRLARHGLGLVAAASGPAADSPQKELGW